VPLQPLPVRSAGVVGLPLRLSVASLLQLLLQLSDVVRLFQLLFGVLLPLQLAQHFASSPRYRDPVEASLLPASAVLPIQQPALFSRALFAPATVVVLVAVAPVVNSPRSPLPVQP
jgi:hypothetical protein